MSDDKFLGNACCCIPTRWFVMIVAGATLFFNAIELAYVVIVKWMLGESATPQHCHGPQCNDIATCRGMAEATFEVRQIIFLVGGVVFGYFGERGAANGHPTPLYYFASFLYAKIAIIVGSVLFDGSYFWVCGAYTWNVIYESVMLPTPHWPFPEHQKAAIAKGPKWFPEGQFGLNEIEESMLWPAYFVRFVPELLFYFYVARVTLYLAEHVAFGVYGLGANHGMNLWRDSLIQKGRNEETWLQAQQDANDMKADITFQERPIPKVKLPPGNYYGATEDWA